MLNAVVTWIQARMVREDGQDLIEYALLGGLIAAALIAVIALGVMTDAVESMANGISECIDFDGTAGCMP
jgi:Flp pilus assembly pilin Flp